MNLAIRKNSKTLTICWTVFIVWCYNNTNEKSFINTHKQKTTAVILIMCTEYHSTRPNIDSSHLFTERNAYLKLDFTLMCYEPLSLFIRKV